MLGRGKQRGRWRDFNDSAEIHYRHAVADVFHDPKIVRNKEQGKSKFLLQFDQQIQGSREDAAKRLGRELDLAVERFAREAQQVLAERMAQVGNQGAETVDRRLTQLRGGLERQRDEFFTELERRVQEVESQLRERLGDLSSDAEAERLVIEARLHQVARRVDDLVARAEAQLR